MSGIDAPPSDFGVVHRLHLSFSPLILFIHPHLHSHVQLRKSFLLLSLSLSPKPSPVLLSPLSTNVAVSGIDDEEFLDSYKEKSTADFPHSFCFCINSMAVAVSSPAFVSGDDLPADYGEWFPKDSRRAGVLLHPTSFPGPYSIGEEAFRFINWLLDSGWSLWLFGRIEITRQLMKKSPALLTMIGLSKHKKMNFLASDLYKQSKDEIVAGRILDKYIDFKAVTFEAIFNDESFKEYFEKMEGLKT